MNKSADPLLHEGTRLSSGTHNRRSLAGRISASVARQMSYSEVQEEPRTGGLVGTTINTLSNVVGAGVLSLPLCFYQASVLGALLLLAYTCVLSVISSYIIIIAAHRMQRFSYTEVFAFSLFYPRTFDEFFAKKPIALEENAAYPEVGTMEMEKMKGEHKQDESLRRKRRRIVTILIDLMIFLYNYGTLIVYARVIADSIPPVVRSFLHGHGFVVTRAFWLIISGIVFFALTCVRNMSELKWTSLLGFLTIFYVIVVIVVRFITSRADPPYPCIDPEEHGETNWYNGGIGAFQALSTICLAFGFHYNIPYFYRELKHREPKNMFKCITFAFPTILVCYVVAGLIGYLLFGDLVSSKSAGGDIMSNFPDDDVIANVARLGLFVHFACVYPILSVCARRGLHRVVMHALTAIYESSLTDEERALSETQSDEGEHAERELLGTRQSTAAERDVGSPETTTRLAIVLEAFFMVSTTVLLAAFIPGVGLMINVLGALFANFLVFSGPGVIAWCFFSHMPLLNPNLEEARTYRRGRLFKCIAVLLVFTGAFSTVTGLAFVIKGNV